MFIVTCMYATFFSIIQVIIAESGTESKANHLRISSNRAYMYACIQLESWFDAFVCILMVFGYV